MEQKPQWFTIGNDLLWPLVGMGLATIQAQKFSSLDIESLPYLALCHHAGCLQVSMLANERGKHSVALCLVRQSIEALTVVDIGLQETGFAERHLRAWKEGNKSHGELRKALEKEIWPRYGTGLWTESWSEFYANFARAVQPYAHYTPELQGWQFATFLHNDGLNFMAMVGLETYDPLQATRITLFHMLLTWMLGCMLLAHGKNDDVLAHRDRIKDLGNALASSKLLFKGGEWWKQFAPHMLFKVENDWRDDA